MTSSISEQTFHFPSEETIIAYLTKHPLTGTKTIPFFTEQKIIPAVAKFFANQEKYNSGVDLGVMDTMEDLNNEKLHFSEERISMLNLNLIKALIDCANNKQI